MSHPGAANADGVRRIEILSARWERIQITVRIRSIDDRPLDPASIRLHEADHAGRRGDHGRLVRPARASLDDDGVVTARFNVMQGPDQDPLPPGRWSMVALSGGKAEGHRRFWELAAADRDAARAVLDGCLAAFPLTRGRYAVAPVLDGDGRLALSVTMGPPEPLLAAGGGTAEGDDPDSLARSTLARIARPIRQLRPLAFRVLYRAIAIASRRNGRRILFTSDSRAELGGNQKIVYDRMVERGLDRTFELRTLFRESITVRRGFRDRLRLPWVLARADTIVIDDYQPVIAHLTYPDARIIQLWHAWGAFKTVGYSRVGKPGGLSPYSRVHKNYAIAIVSSASEVAAYAEAFGIPESRVVPTGIPRMDLFWDPARAAASREATLQAYPAARGRRVFLFAPTFRGHGAKTATYDMGLLDIPALHASCVAKDAVCLIRMHPFVRTPLDIPAAYADRIIDGSTSSIDINDVLFATDLLITDYSSVVFEFSTMDRPMLFFAPDLEEYIASRDFYVDYPSFVPGRIVRTFADLLDAIRREDFGAERLAAFRTTHLDRFDGQATDRVIDLIIATQDRPEANRG